MAINAVQAFGKMPGGSQSQLMLCADGNLWVVKFKNNPQHISALSNQLVASLIAQSIGLSVPQSNIVQVDSDLIAKRPDLFIERSRGLNELYAPGLNLGSQFAGTLMPGTLFQGVTDQNLGKVSNLREFAGALVLDIWMHNTDFRQAVFVKKHHTSRDYTVKFIDFGHCSGVSNWPEGECQFRGFYRQHRVYETIEGWDDFQPWLDSVRFFDPSVLWKFVQSVPNEWMDGIQYHLEAAVDRLVDRGLHIGMLVGDFIGKNPHWFTRFSSPR